MTESHDISKSRPLAVAWYGVNIIYWFSWLAALLLVAMVIAVSAAGFTPTYVQLPIQVDMYETSEGSVVEPITTGSSIQVVGFSNLRVRADGMGNLEYVIWMPLVLLAGFIWLVYLLRKLLRNVRHGDTFLPQNPALLKLIGWLVVVAGPFLGLLQHLYARIYINQVDIPKALLSPVTDLHISTVVAGLIIVVIAQIYAEAVRIKTEADLTI